MAKQGLKGDVEKKLTSELLLLDKEIKRRESVGHPGHYGMSDLLFPRGFAPGVYSPFDERGDVMNRLAGTELYDGWMRDELPHEETVEEYEKRQDEILGRFVTEHIFIIKDGRKVYVRVIPALLDWIAGIFFKRVSRTITWKPRGGGGSLSAAVLIWLLLVYRKVSVLDVAGSADQARIVYDYVKEFWDCVPGLKAGLIYGEPLAQVTKLITGAEIRCVPATEKQARGKHYSVVFVDELCQSDPRVETAMLAAIQGALSEPDPVICLFSTFHIPHGMFQKYWDEYEEKGFTRYHWNVFDTSEVCTRGMDQATEKDPKALEYCKTCFLTEKHSIRDMSGKYEVESWDGCYGQSRDSQGWATFDRICEAKKMNMGTAVFETEYACGRPGYSTCVYPPEMIDASLIDPIYIDPNEDKVVVGIDWGIQTAGSLAIILIARRMEYVYIADIMYADHTLVSEVADLLNKWGNNFGKFPVIADASHPFNNAELKEAGFDVRPASFGSWKKIGVENVSKYFVFKRLRINRTLETLISQLKKFRRSETSGNIIKKDDHGPDAMMCGLLNFRFEDEFGPDIAQAAALEEQMRMLEKKRNQDAKKDAVTFSEEGVGEISVEMPDFISAEVLANTDSKKNILVF